MMISMRTTVTLDDCLITHRKRRAAVSGTSITRVVQEGNTELFDLIAFGAGGRFSLHNVDRTSTLLDVDDVERHGGHE